MNIAQATFEFLLIFGGLFNNFIVLYRKEQCEPQGHTSLEKHNVTAHVKECKQRTEDDTNEDNVEETPVTGQSAL